MPITLREADPSHSPPPAAMLLGGAGLLPPLIYIGGRLLHRLPPGPSILTAELRMIALGYVALILSFLGGMWWGIAASRLTAHRIGPWLAVAVLPSLVAWGAFLATRPPWGTALVLAGGLLLALPVDLRLVREGLAPGWWIRLRVPLSTLLAAETIAVAALA